MVEGAGQPVVRVVAHRTIGRVTLCLVVERCIVLRLVAAVTISPRTGQVALVAVGALNYGFMAARQFKARGGMVEA